MAFVRVASAGELPDRGLVAVEAEGEKVVLIVTEPGVVYALKDRCSHADYPLSDGEILSDGKRLECMYHGAKFDIESGRAVALPAIRPVPRYDVRIDGDDVLVDVS